MGFIEIAVRAVGLFYAAGAILLIRQMAMSEVLDRAIAAINLRREETKVIVRRWLLGAGAALTGASGAAALLLSWWAVPLFAANLVLQGAWLAWAVRAFPPEDEEEALGRRRTFNAFFFYATVTVTVFALAYEGRLRPWGEWQTALPVAVAVAAYTIYLARCLGWLAPSGRGGDAADDEDFDPAAYGDAEEEIRHPSRIRFEVHPWRYPVVDADDGRLLSHYTYLDYETANEIEAWHSDYAGFVTGAGEGATSVFPSEEVEAEHRAQAEGFVEHLRAIYGRENVEGPVYLPRETWELADEDDAIADRPAGGDAGGRA